MRQKYQQTGSLASLATSAKPERYLQNFVDKAQIDSSNLQKNFIWFLQSFLIYTKLCLFFKRT